MDYLLKASAVIALFYLCFYFFLKKETFFNHNRWFLLIGLVVALLFPFIVIPIYSAVEPQIIPETAVLLNKNISENIQIVAQKPKFEWQILIPVAYSIGLALFLIQFLFQFGSLILLLLKSKKNKAGSYTHVIVNSKTSPFSFFKWIVYNPESFNETELQLMLTHEKVHARQMHSLDILFTQLSCAVFWFNPLIWLYRKEVKQNLEYIADFKTQETSISEKTYQRLLLKTSVANHKVLLSNNFYNSLIKDRILMLKKSRSNRKKQWKYLLMFPLLAILLMSMNTEKIYVESDTIIETSKQTVEFVVTKNTTDSELNNISHAIKKRGGSIVFSQVERNTQNELISIFVKFYNHSYGNGGGQSPIDSFLIYKELYGKGGGYVGRLGNGTAHFNKNLDDVSTREINDLKKRADKAIIKNGIQTAVAKQPNRSNFGAIEIVFTKDMTDKQLDDTIKELKSNNITMTIKRLKRNSEGKITAITINFETEGGSTNYNVKDTNGIDPFYFNMSTNGSFGVGATKEKEIVIAQSINNTNAQIKGSNRVFNKADVEITEFIEIVEDTIHANYSIDNAKLHDKDSITKIYGYTVGGSYLSKNRDSLFISKSLELDTVQFEGLPISKYELNYLENANFENIKSPQTTKSISNVSFYDNQNLKPLIIINGKIASEQVLKTINPTDIAKMNILKGNSAIKLYGEQGKNGVVVITMKVANSTKGKKSSTISKSPWRVEVSNVTYVDDADTSINGTLAYITKYTSNEILDKHKSDLEKFGLKVKISKVRRNKNKEITSIKISISDEKGNKSSASFSDNDGISGLEFGQSKGALVLKTTTMN